MKHHIKYINHHPGYHVDLSCWECEKCYLSPFKPCVVAIGEVGEPGFRVVSEPLDRHVASSIKTCLNLIYNQAIYYLLPYETFLEYRFGSALGIEIDFKNTRRGCYPND